MLLKCPESPFLRKDTQMENPEEMLVISTQKFHPQQKQPHNNFNAKCTNPSKSKVEAIKKNIRDNLINEDLAESH